VAASFSAGNQAQASPGVTALSWSLGAVTVAVVGVSVLSATGGVLPHALKTNTLENTTSTLEIRFIVLPVPLGIIRSSPDEDDC
jgi:hypothetical protein